MMDDVGGGDDTEGDGCMFPLKDEHHKLE